MHAVQLGRKRKSPRHIVRASGCAELETDAHCAHWSENRALGQRARFASFGAGMACAPCRLGAKPNSATAPTPADPEPQNSDRQAARPASRPAGLGEARGLHPTTPSQARMAVAHGARQGGGGGECMPRMDLGRAEGWGRKGQRGQKGGRGRGGGSLVPGPPLKRPVQGLVLVSLHQGGLAACRSGDGCKGGRGARTTTDSADDDLQQPTTTDSTDTNLQQPTAPTTTDDNRPRRRQPTTTNSTNNNRRQPTAPTTTYNNRRQPTAPTATDDKLQETRRFGFRVPAPAVTIRARAPWWLGRAKRLLGCTTHLYVPTILGLSP